MRPLALSLALLFLCLLPGRLDAAGWRSHGPEGGAVRMLLEAPSDPRVLYMTPGTTLFRSSDLGRTWNRVDGPFTTVLTFAIDPHDSQTVIVVNGSGKLYKTGDGGASWKAVAANLAPWQWTSSIAIDPRDSDVVYVARNCGPHLEPFFEGAGVYKSIDGGVTFTAAMQGMIGFQRCVSGLTLDPLNPDLLYTRAQYSDNGSARSEDGALTWTRASTVLPEGTIVADPRDPARRLANGSGVLLTSTDGGATWVRKQPAVLDSNSPLPLGTTLLTVDQSSGRLFIAGHHGVYRSGDGGNSLLALPGAARLEIYGMAFEEATGTLTIGTASGAYQSSAYPWSEWTLLDTRHRTLDMRDVEASRVHAATVYAVSRAHAYVSRDHGVSWSVLAGPLPATASVIPSMAELTVDVADNLYVAGRAASSSKVYKLAAGTTNWVELTPPIADFGRLVADPGTPNVVYLLRPNTPALMATRDGGASWNFHFTPAGGANDLAIDPRDGAVFYAATNTGLFKSSDGGQTWAALSPLRTFAGVRISPADPNTVYAVEHDYATRLHQIHVSHDAGATWTAHAGPGETVSLAPSRHDPRTLIVSVTSPVSGGTIYQSRDAGRTWTDISGALPIDHSRLAWSLDGSVLHATTTLRGMWELSPSTRRRSVTPP